MLWWGLVGGVAVEGILLLVDGQHRVGTCGWCLSIGSGHGLLALVRRLLLVLLRSILIRLLLGDWCKPCETVTPSWRLVDDLVRIVAISELLALRLGFWVFKQVLPEGPPCEAISHDASTH